MSHLQFIELPYEGKTLILDVCTADGEEELGFIKWHAPWRQYIFEPNEDTIFSHDCLQEIVDKIKALMAQRKVKKG
jgi:hypothetical protein